MEDFSSFTDEALAKKAPQNMEAFAALIQRYEAKLMRYIFRISSFCQESAEEILQDVFLKAWKNLNGFRGDVSFQSWIYRITHNETISVFRKHKSRGMHLSVELEESLFVPDENSDLTLEFDQKLSAHHVQIVLEDLPKAHREILVLCYLEDLSYNEMADILKCPAGTVATKVHRAKEAFRASASYLSPA